MKISLKLAFLMIFLFSSPSFAQDPWSTQDYVLEATWLTLHMIDHGQTLDIAKNPRGHYEINPFLGKHPSVENVNVWMGAGYIIHPVITHFLPKKYRPYWQMFTIGVTGSMVFYNYQVGLKINF